MVEKVNKDESLGYIIRQDSVTGLLKPVEIIQQ